MTCDRLGVDRSTASTLTVKPFILQLIDRINEVNTDEAQRNVSGFWSSVIGVIGNTPTSRNGKRIERNAGENAALSEKILWLAGHAYRILTLCHEIRSLEGQTIAEYQEIVDLLDTLEGQIQRIHNDLSALEKAIKTAELPTHDTIQKSFEALKKHQEALARYYHLLSHKRI